MLLSLLSPEFRRKRLLKHLESSILRELYRIPFPPSDSDSRSLDYIALDLETTGIDPARDEILSLGWVAISSSQIDLSSVQHRLVQTSRSIPEQSAVIHHITDDQAASGEPLYKVLEEFLPLLAGKVLIAHHAYIEVNFLRRACRHYFDSDFFLRVIDTQEIARRKLQRRGHPIRSNELRLPTLRQQYGLPRHLMHNALSDALAAAELFLAQLAQYDCEKPVPLKNFLLKV